jgi:hypothetical protein
MVIILGKGIDIDHPNLEVIESEIVGKVAVIMKRRCKEGRRVFE